MLLSIAIPAYGRAGPLRKGLESFIAQISGRHESDVEIIVADDASPDNSLAFVEDLARRYPFIRYIRYAENIGLERNLIECTSTAKGEFLWIFGDDDFLEPDDAIDDIIARLRSGQHDMLVLNRTRRSADLSKCLSENWMRLDGRDRSYPGLRDFCLEFGFISVIGFISVNIFRRKPFQAVDPGRYFGTMYPQLGMMLEAFHNRPVELVARPIVCHRTQTADEKRAALGEKASEANFMADTNRRNALYFSHPYIAMVNHLVDLGAFSPEDITQIHENTVINGLLIDFLIDCADKSREYADSFSNEEWKTTRHFFNRLPLTAEQKAALSGVFDGPQTTRSDAAGGSPRGTQTMLTISVVSPSYNQAEFLDECLSSVRDQTYQPIEHFVFDPGSTDGSRDIARKYKSVTLFEEPDEGQSDALNKGFARAKGDIIAWLNSDDVFASPSVFQRVIDRFNQPDAPDIVYGKGIYIDETGNKLRDVYINKKPETLPWRLQQEDGILQPALFMRRSVIEDVGELTGSRHYCMDYEYWIRCIAAGKKFAYVDEDFALARYHNNNKTYGQRGKSYAEVCDMLVTHFGYANHIWLRRYAEFLSDGFDGVLAHGQNSDIADKDRLEEIYRQLLIDYNGSKMVMDHLAAKASQKGYGDTLREMQRLGIEPSVPCVEVSADTVAKKGCALYTVGPRRWAFDADWKKRELDKAYDYIREQRNKRQSDVCVIVGNGPSLKKSNLDLLKGHDVIISNNAFLDKKLSELATYYTVVNYLVAEQSAHHINRLEGLAKILPYWTGYCLNPGEDTYFIEAVGHARFSKDIFKNASWRHTVTFFNMHIAFGLGYKRAVLIGFDHSYKQQTGLKEGDVIVSKERDENHFDSTYFQGKKWQAADVGMMEQMYLLAKKAYEEEGRELINATEGGALEVLPRMSLVEALSMKPVTEEAKVAAKVAGKRSMDEHIREYPRERHAQVDETDVVARLLAARKGSDKVMLDVGAHIGTSAQCFHDLGWSIHCFEPDEKNRNALLERFRNAPNVRIDSRAVSDVAASGVQFFTSGQSTGISGLHAFHETHTLSGSVDVTTLADVVRNRNLSHVDFLKIDVEGFDLNVLKGVPWDKLKPDVVECEFEDAKTVKLGHTWKDIAEYLRARGYTVYISEWHPIVRYGIAHDWRRVVPYEDHSMADDAWGNLLAFQEDPGYPAIVNAFDELMKFRGSQPKAVAPAPPKTNGNGSPPAVSSNDSPKAAMPKKAKSEPVNSKVANPDPPKPPPEKKKPAEAKSADVKNTESRASMLQMPPNASSPVLPSPPQKAQWYVNLAGQIHRVSPRLYNLLRFLRRGMLHSLLRPLLLIPLIVIAALFAAAIFAPGLAPYRGWLFAAEGFGILATFLVYVAFRSQAHAEALHLQVSRLEAELLNRPSVTRLERLSSRVRDTLNVEKVRADKLGRAVEEMIRESNARFDELDRGLRDARRNIRNSESSLDKALQANRIAERKIEQLANTNTALKARIARLETLLGLGSQMESLRKEVTEKTDALRAEVTEATNALRSEVTGNADTLRKEIGEKTDALRAKVTEATNALRSEVTGNADTLRKEIGEKTDTLHAEITKETNALRQEVTGNADALRREVAENTGALRVEVAEETKALRKDVTGNTDTLRKEVAEKADILRVKIAEEASALRQELTGKVVSVEGKLEKVDKWAQFDNSVWYQHFNRRLTNEQIKTFDAEWRKRLSLPISRAVLGYMANRACEMERLLDGRLATSVEDILLRSLVARAVKGPRIDILEIGTLFGVGAGVMFDAIANHFEDIHFTLLDPLEGYYNANQADILTGQRIDERTLRRNLARAGMNEDQYTLIKKLSTDIEAIEIAAVRKYDVLIIDADHSYAGVKADFENYAQQVKLGGYIIFDDYSSPDWPDVQEYVDSEVEDMDFIARVGADWRTCVYRVVKRPSAS